MYIYCEVIEGEFPHLRVGYRCVVCHLSVSFKCEVAGRLDGYLVLWLVIYSGSWWLNECPGKYSCPLKGQFIMVLMYRWSL